MTDNPQVLMAVSLFLILACIIVIILFIIFVHSMPGKIARKRDNPQAEAIEILSLLGLLIFPLWMVALIWSYMKPFTVPVTLISDSGESSDTVEPASRPIEQQPSDKSGEV